MSSFTEWLQNPKHFILTFLSVFGFVLLSYYLITVFPRQLEENTLKSFADSYPTTASAVDDLATKVGNVMPWFTQSYQKPVSDNLKSAQDAIVQANTLLNQAKSLQGPEFYAVTDKAKVALETAKTATTAALNLIDTDVTLRKTAREQFGSVSTEEDKEIGLYNGAKTRFDTELTDQLPVYTTPIGKQFVDASEKITSLRSNLASAGKNLPSDDSKAGTGDPNAAIGFATVAKQRLDEMKKLKTDALQAMDDLKTAKDNAKTTNADAATKLQNALAHIDATVSDTFHREKSLKDAVTLQAQGVSEHDEAEVILSSPNQLGQIDWPMAYKKALHALDLAKSSVTAVDTQVYNYTYVKDQLAGFENAVSQANSHVTQGDDAQNTLISYHATNTWGDVSTKLALAKQSITDAKTAHTDAQTAFSDERYADAKTLTDQITKLLSDAKDDADAVVTKKTTLEGFRSAWPNAKSDAELQISRGPRYFSMFDWHSSSARELFSQAKRDFDTAVSKANSNYWQEAVTLVKKAGTDAATATAKEKRAKQADEDEATQTAKNKTAQAAKKPTAKPKR